MYGKRFSTPGSSLVRDRGAPQAAGPSRAARITPTRRDRAQQPPRTFGSAPRQHRVPSPSYGGGGASPEISARAAAYTPLSASTGAVSRAASAGNVHGMLSELVHLSQSIAAYIDQDPVMMGSMSSDAGPSARANAALKAQEIERIVGRVQAHYKAKLDALQQENDDLRRRLAAATAGAASQAAEHTSPSRVRDGLEDQEAALDELSRTWGGAKGNSDIAQLQRILLAEKRQRLLVEEQTQSLTEQHAKVVSTLERRLRKQEEQLQDLIGAVERNYHPNGSRAPTPANAQTAGSSSPPNGQVTPRRLLRQQLAQHQQTQRALQQYRAHLDLNGHAANAAMDEDDHDDVDAVLPADSVERGEVQETLQAIRNSTPPVAATAAVQRQPPPPPLQQATGGGSQAVKPLPVAAPPAEATSVDDIGAYLDSITRELETLGADDDFM